MFDLTAFDAEISRWHTSEGRSDDVLLARALRSAAQENALTTLSMATGAAFSVLAFAAMALPAVFSSPAQAMTANGMTVDQFAVHMNMPMSDPLLLSMFEQLCMI